MSATPHSVHSSAAQRVLVVTPDTIGKKMGGPAIRAWEIARRLSSIAEVRLVSVKNASLSHHDFEVLTADDPALQSHVAWADVVIGQGEVFTLHPWLVESDAIIVADIYDPLHLEVLESAKDQGDESRAFLVKYCVDMLTLQLRRADYMICASEKQRDFWLGHLGSLGRISPENYDADQSLRNLIDVVPFGVPDEDSIQTHHAIRDKVPGISADDKVIIWGGGVYNWFDPLTLVRAVGVLAQRRPNLKLYFMGMTYPNPEVHQSRVAADTITLSDELGLTGSHVIFNTDWVDYDDRINHLMDADVGVSTHLNHIETAFSFRTRILDYFWAGLPIIATDGDAFAPVIRRNGLGAVVPAQDVDALVEALDDLLFARDTTGIRENVRSFSRRITWDRAIRPLVDFINNPAHAADYPLSRDESLDAHRRRHIELLEATILQLDAEKGSAQEKLAIASGELEKIYRSRSWKVGAPVRVLARLARRLKQR